MGSVTKWICDRCGKELPRNFTSIVSVKVEYHKWHDSLDEYWRNTLNLTYHIPCYRELVGMPSIEKTIEDEKRTFLGGKKWE